MKLTLELDGELTTRLQEKAKHLNVPVEELAAAFIRDQCRQLDEEFEKAADYLFEKNRELYRRLS